MAEDQNNKKPEPSAGKSDPATGAVNPEDKSVLDQSTQSVVDLEHLSTKVVPRQPRTKHEHLLDASSIALYIGDLDDPLVVRLSEKIVLGRAGPLTDPQPSVDLSSYHALDLGVSRMHAAIRRSEHDLLFEDLDSSNGSHLNGERVIPHVAYRLQSGAVIALGRLTLQIYFKSTNGPAEPSPARTKVLDKQSTNSAPSENALLTAKSGSAAIAGPNVLQAIPGTIRFSIPDSDQTIQIDAQLVMIIRNSAGVDSPQTLEIGISAALNRTEPGINDLLARLKAAGFTLNLK